MSTPTLFAYLPRKEAEALCKMAEGEAKKNLRAAGTLLAAPVGMGVGTLAGFGAGQLANKAYRHVTGSDIPPALTLAALPMLGGGLGLAYNMAQARQVEAMRNALEGSDNKPGGRLP
jgi:hypothetical protein